NEYNRRYRALWGRDLTYAEIIDKESSILLAYLLKGDMDPWMFHQSNLRAYDEVHTLLGDLLDRVLEKYDRLSTVPILSPAMGDLGQRMAKRMQYDAADVAATVVPGESITLSARNAATVPVTGLRLPDAETYGNQTIAYIALGADQTITVPLP